MRVIPIVREREIVDRPIDSGMIDGYLITSGSTPFLHHFLAMIIVLLTVMMTSTDPVDGYCETGKKGSLT